MQPTISQPPHYYQNKVQGETRNYDFIFHKCHNIDNSSSLVLGWNCFLDTSTGSGGGGVGVGGGGEGGGGGQGIDPCEEGPGHSGARTLSDGTGERSKGGQGAPGEDFENLL